MIEFAQVSFGYHKKAVIEDINLSIKRGGITAIIGPNGCGKSTLLKLMSGLLTPTTGEIFLDGELMVTMKRKAVARRCAYLAQEHRRPHLNVKDLVMSGRYPYQSLFRPYSEADEQVVNWAISNTNSDKNVKKLCVQLSGGELQRVFIATILAQDTEYILLDEPTTYLDLGVAYQLMELIRCLNQKYHKTIVMVSHDLKMAFQYADRLLLMDKGKIMKDGTAEEIAKSPLLEQIFTVKVRCFQEQERLFYCFDSLKEP